MGDSNSLLGGLAYLLNLALTIYMWMVVVRALISWVSPNPYNPVVRFLTRATDPALQQIRRLLPLNPGGLDFSPVILIVLLIFCNDFLVVSLKWIGAGRPFTGVGPIFVISLLRLIQGILFAYMIVLIVRAVLSWLSPDPYNPIVAFAYGLTEPILYRLRRVLPLVMGGVDLTPLALIAIIYLLNSLLDRVMFTAVQALS